MYLSNALRPAPQLHGGARIQHWLGRCSSPRTAGGQLVQLARRVMRACHTLN